VAATPRLRRRMRTVARMTFAYFLSPRLFSLYPLTTHLPAHRLRLYHAPLRTTPLKQQKKKAKNEA